MSKYNNEMDKAEANTKALGKSSDNLAGTLKGLFTLGLAQQVAGMVNNMVALGNEANATEDRFRALTSTMGTYEETMIGLRKATLGAVDDMALQQGAMLLVQTANIETNAELERMMRLITMTKKPSEDMTTAIQNFGLMLANNSILRLDSFGISASKVRERIIELQETMGVDRSEAFRMAVLEEGEKNIRKFGDAADAASTSLGRLGVMATNVFQDFAQDAASGAQGFGLAIEYMLGITPAQQAQTKQRIDEAAISLAMDLQTAFDAAMSGGAFGEDPQFVGTFIQNALDMAAKDPALLADMEGFMNQIFGKMGSTPSSEFLQFYRDTLEQTLQIQAANQSQRDMDIEIADEQQRISDIEAERIERNERGLAQQAEFLSYYERGLSALHDSAIEEQRIAGIRAQMIGQLGESGQAAFSAAFSMNGQSAPGSSVPEYMTQNQADQVQSQADAVALLVDQMKALNEETAGTFSEEEIEQYETVSEKLGDMADEAQNAADAFANMSLSELLGQDDGGRLADEMDAVIEKMKELGAESWELNNAQRAFDLRTGRESGLSLAFQDQITTFNAQIYEQQGADAAVAFMAAYDETLAQAKLMGIDTNNPDFVSAVTQTFTNPLDTANFDIQGFLSGFQPAADSATVMKNSMMVMAEDGSLVSQSFFDMADKAPIITENMGLIEGSLGGAVTHADKLKTNLDDMSSKTYTLKIQPEMVNIPALISMLLPGLVQMVQAAGGTMPGTSQQASSSGPMTQQGYGAQ